MTRAKGWPPKNLFGSVIRLLIVTGKQKYCEIDIISPNGDTIYFTEVKHRKNTEHGDGLEVIIPRKRRQMTFAARMYAQAHKLTNVNLQLLAIATTGNNPVVELVIEIV
ncbi:MAG TPA: YraN family protein [Candidatus Saccharimonadales bacterium]|nr:YraN family protein [Candidatus Saccharimonadales bacterium]